MRKVLLMTVAGLLLTVPAYAASFMVPNAGSLNEELKQERHFNPKAGDKAIDAHAPVPAGQTAGNKIQVNGLNIVGNEAFAKNVLLDAGGWKGAGQMSFAQLQEICNKISKYYQSKGYLTAYAYMPVQEVSNGVVTIRVMDGHYGEVTLNNKSQVTDTVLRSISRKVKAGRIIEKVPLDRALVLMNDLPGTKVFATMEPSKTSGAADMHLEAIETERNGATMWVDNFGNKNTGKYRVGANFHENNPGNIGDLFSVSYVQGNGGIKNWDIRYEAPFTRTGTVAGVSYSKLTYSLMKEFAWMDAYGDARTWQLYLKTPLKRTMYNNLYFNVYYEDRKLRDVIDYFGTDAEKESRVFRFALDGDSRNAKSSDRYVITHSIGKLYLQNDDAKLFDKYGTEGQFQKTEAELYHIQQLTPKWQLHLDVRGQYAYSDLDSSEKMYIGGYSGVRAFPQGESGGDSSFLGTAEFRYQMDRQWALAAFYDYGWTQYNRSPLGKSEESRVLGGVGLGVIWRNSDRDYARMDYAIPTTDRYSYSEGDKINGQWWFQWVHRF